MILDLILKGNFYELKIHRKFFQNESIPLELFQEENQLTKKYSYLGIFQIKGNTFGFDGCFVKQKGSNDEYVIYKFDFPKSEDDYYLGMRKMMLTMYLSTYYVVEQMHYAKEFFNDTIWDDQAFSFVIFDGNSGFTGGYAIGGQIYSWIKRKLLALNEEDLINLNKYVEFEVNRISNYFFKKDAKYSQITITQNSIFIQVNMQGRWISWTNSRDIFKKEEFSSHNIDFHSDQELCFVAIVAINTWLREH
ncbi:MAG: hypothetical protein WC264_03025 [Candidatus Paceibacterota bacterium]|jgi:hypothetical protein